MAYALDLADLPGSAAAAAHEQLRDAVEQLEAQHGQDPEKAVHEARKDVKKVRALLRLLRPVLPPRVRQAENAALRGAAGSISGARDADVMVSTLEGLRDRAAGRVAGSAIDHAVEHLRERSAAARGNGGGSVVAALAALRAADVRVEAWAPGRLSRKDVAAGMSRTYGDGRAAMRAARKDPSTEALHDWRKRVKDLWYEERLITAAWPPLLEASSSELKVLSELLGDDHDLAVLAEHLPELPPGLEDLPEIID